VLSALARTTRPLTGREIARLTERSEAGVRNTLRRLVAEGLVDVQEAGKARLHVLNRHHVAAPAVELLANVRTELVRRLEAELASWEIRPRYASVFGSFARGEGDVESDIDLLVVRAEEVDESDALWRKQVAELATDVRRWTGNHASIADLSVEEFRRLQDDRPPIHAALQRESIALLGEPDEVVTERRS
jgi:predicted nucleotidyltransferase